MSCPSPASQRPISPIRSHNHSSTPLIGRHQIIISVDIIHTSSRNPRIIRARITAHRNKVHPARHSRSIRQRQRNVPTSRIHIIHCLSTCRSQHRTNSRRRINTPRHSRHLHSSTYVQSSRRTNKSNRRVFIISKVHCSVITKPRRASFYHLLTLQYLFGIPPIPTTDGHQNQHHSNNPNNPHKTPPKKYIKIFK